MVDVTPQIPLGRQLIQAYGNGGFRIADTAHSGSVLVFPEETLAWPPVSWQQVDLAGLAPVIKATPKIEVLLIGCGPVLLWVPDDIRDGLRAAGIVVDGMDTGAACRTYNVLLAEERRVAAALIAID